MIHFRAETVYFEDVIVTTFDDKIDREFSVGDEARRFRGDAPAYLAIEVIHLLHELLDPPTLDRAAVHILSEGADGPPVRTALGACNELMRGEKIVVVELLDVSPEEVNVIPGLTELAHCAAFAVFASW